MIKKITSHHGSQSKDDRMQTTACHAGKAPSLMTEKTRLA
jgi:hypothetical protein